jgi:general secretion pathway protein G
VQTRTTNRGRVRRGFTLIELLIVIAILLALIGIVAGTYLAVSDQSDVDLQRFQIEMIDKELERFKLDMKRYPSEAEGLAALWDSSTLETEEDEASWRGPYLEEPIEKDTWGSDLVYYAPSQLNEGAEYDIVSPGPDREEGTDDDITNHQGGASTSSESSGDQDFTVD